jgi:hypothetical protein
MPFIGQDVALAQNGTLGKIDEFQFCGFTGGAELRKTGDIQEKTAPGTRRR